MNRFCSASVMVSSMAMLPTMAASAATITYYSPESVSNIAGRVYADAAPPLHLTNVSVFRQGSNAISQSITNWNVGTYSGATSATPLADHQRGNNNDWAGSSCVAMSGTQTSLMINTWSLAPDSSNGANAQLKYQWESSDNLRPWAFTTSKLNMSFDVQVPSVSHDPNGAVGVVSAIGVVDSTTGQSFGLQQQIYDSRNAWNWEDAAWDDATGGYSNSYFGPNTVYGSMLPGSHTSVGVNNWSGFRYYGFSISCEQVLNVINDLNSEYDAGLSTNPSDYWLLMMTIQEEVYWGPGANVAAAVSLDNVHVWETHEVPEPGTLALLVVGLLAIGWRCRRVR